MSVCQLLPCHVAFLHRSSQHLVTTFPKVSIGPVLNTSKPFAGLLCCLAPHFGPDAELLEALLGIPRPMAFLRKGAALALGSSPQISPTLAGVPLICVQGIVVDAEVYI